MMFSCILWIICIRTVLGHGKLWEPPSRSTMWRRGFKTPVNPNDHELNCGGFQNHWIKYGGRCGVCGDPYQLNPRPNEAGGEYATGIITRRYKSGEIIDLAVDITANHVGYFEFRICPNNNFKVPVTQQCLNKHPIFVVGSKDGRYHVEGNQNGIVVFKGKLPKDLECSQCVIQWRYRTGNRWGCNKRTGKCGKGYGPQEEFYGCSDVSVGDHYTERRMSMRKPVSVSSEKLKSNIQLLTNPSDIIHYIGNKNSASPVFDKLTNILWTLLQTIVSTNRGSRVALVQWNPIGHDIVELGNKNQLPVFKVSSKSEHKVPSTDWPPSKPTVVEADLGEEEDGPMILSEMVVDESWRNPVIRKYTESPNEVIAKESKCHATKDFEKVQGTNQWCIVNCNVGNCPPIMCTCELQATVDHNQIITHSRANPMTTNIQIGTNNLSNNLNSLTHRPVGAPNHHLHGSNEKSIPTIIKHSQPRNFQSNSMKPPSMRCMGAGKFSSHPNMVAWCLENCSKGFCPKSICTCSNNI